MHIKCKFRHQRSDIIELFGRKKGDFREMKLLWWHLFDLVWATCVRPGCFASQVIMRIYDQCRFDTYPARGWTPLSTDTHTRGTFSKFKPGVPSIIKSKSDSKVFLRVLDGGAFVHEKRPKSTSIHLVFIRLAQNTRQSTAKCSTKTQVLKKH